MSISNYLTGIVTAGPKDQGYSVLDMDPNSTYMKNLAAEKAVRLEEKKSRLSQYSNADKDSYTQLPDGNIEDNKNKIWNKLTDDEYASVFSAGVSEYGLQRQGDGTYVDPRGKVYRQDQVTNLYGYGTKESDDTFKMGVAANVGDGNSDNRYLPGRAKAQGSDYKGWLSGAYGVDVNKKQFDIALPNDVAETLEKLQHGRQGAIEDRLYPNANDPIAEAMVGSGKSEYYKNMQSVLATQGTSAGLDYNTAKGLLEQYRGLNTPKTVSPEFGGTPVNNVQAEGAKEDYFAAREADRMGIFGRVGNTLAGFGKSFVQNFALDTADWVGETLKRQTGWGWDVGTEEEKADMASKVFGYNQVLAQRGQQEASKYVNNMWEAATREDVDFKVSDAWNLFKTVMTTPEMIGESVGYVAAMLPGLFGKAAMVATKAAKGIAAANAIKDTAKVAELTPILQAAQKQAAMGKTIGALGLANVATGDVNDQIDQYMKNNEGEAPSAGHIMFKMMPVAVVSTALDKFSMAYATGAAKSVMGVAKEATTELVETLPAAAKAGLWGKVGTAALDISKAAGVEAAQEYTQTMAEIFNKQYDTKKYGDDAGKILTSDENIVEALTASAFGAGQGAQMKAVSPLWDATKAGVGAVGSGIAAGSSAIMDAIPSQDKKEAQEVDSYIAEADTKVLSEEEKHAQAYLQYRDSIEKSPVVAHAAAQLASLPEAQVAFEEYAAQVGNITPEDLEWHKNKFYTDNVVSELIIGSIFDLEKDNEEGQPKAATVDLLRGMRAYGDVDSANMIVDALLGNISDPKVAETRAEAFKSSKVYGSDKDFLDLMYEVVATRPEVTTEQLVGMAKEARYDIDTSVLEELVGAARLEPTVRASVMSVTGKSKGQVTDDVLSGSKGMITFYTDAVKAKSVGNTKQAQDSISRLGKFVAVQERKLEDIAAVAGKFRSEMSNELNKLKQNRVAAGMDQDTAHEESIKELKQKYDVQNGTENNRVAKVGSFTVAKWHMITAEEPPVMNTIRREIAVGKDLQAAYENGKAVNKATLDKVEAMITGKPVATPQAPSVAPATHVAVQGELDFTSAEQAPVTVQEASPTTPLVINGNTRYNDKDRVKFAKATKLIGYSDAPRSSTHTYIQDNKNVVNTGVYNPGEVVGVSLNGASRPNSESNYLKAKEEVIKALEAGATVIQDNAEDRNRAFNVATEGRLAKELSDLGYTESTEGSGVWSKPTGVVPPTTTGKDHSNDSNTAVTAGSEYDQSSEYEDDLAYYDQQFEQNDQSSDGISDITFTYPGDRQTDREELVYEEPAVVAKDGIITVDGKTITAEEAKAPRKAKAEKAKADRKELERNINRLQKEIRKAGAGEYSIQGLIKALQKAENSVSKEDQNRMVQLLKGCL